MNNKTSLSAARIIKKTGILVDTENSVIIAEGINLRVENKKKHLVGIIDVENALIEIKQGKTFVKIPLAINNILLRIAVEWVLLLSELMIENIAFHI